MNAPTHPIPRERLERFGRLLSEYRRRQAKADQSRRGYYDEDGIRQGGLIAFVRYFWHILEPETELIEGWPLWAICEHLEAVTFGEINRLLMNVPPGFMKSLLTDVLWPAWEWGPMDKAHLRYVAFSYSSSLTERDNGRFGDLVASKEYQTLYGATVRLKKKGDVKVSNTKRGWKLASSVGGVGTGERGDRVVLDDPHNVKESESQTVREETVRWFRESMSDRLNNIKTGAIIVIMQRVHEDDVSGAILSLGFNYCHLCIPLEYEWDRQTREDGSPVATDIGWIDPRYIPMAPDDCDGVLAWEERLPADEVDQLKIQKGPYAWAAQYQQSPAPRGGGIFQRNWWQLWDSPDGKFPVFDYLLASLDSAFTEKEENDPSGLTIWGVFTTKDGQRRIMLVHAWRKHLAFSGDRQKLEPTANEYATWTTIPRDPALSVRFQRWLRRTQEYWGLIEWTAYTCNRFNIDKLLIEAKASGISASQELGNRFGQQKWSVQLCPVVGDKYARAIAAQPTFSQQLVYAPARDWAEMVIDEMAVFPKGKYKDLTDSSTQAIKHLRDQGLAQTDDERSAAEAERVTHKPAPKPLYPV
jgi:predicted phage terminase large subunit-like protein